MNAGSGQWMRRAALALVALAATACATQQVSTPASSGGGEALGLGPVLTVERFLQAANTQDLATMAALFGTADGPMGGRREDLELRMNAIALVLQHDDYVIGAETMVPGRSHPTRRVGVDIVQGQHTSEDVPFVVVESRSGAWLVEEIGLDRVTGR